MVDTVTQRFVRIKHKNLLRIHQGFVELIVLDCILNASIYVPVRLL